MAIAIFTVGCHDGEHYKCTERLLQQLENAADLDDALDELKHSAAGGAALC